MSQTNETEIEVSGAEQAAEAEQVDETCLEQRVEVEQHRSERPHMLTEDGKEFHKERLQWLQHCFDSIYDCQSSLI